MQAARIPVLRVRLAPVHQAEAAAVSAAEAVEEAAASAAVAAVEAEEASAAVAAVAAEEAEVADNR